MRAALRTLARRAVCAVRPRTLVLAYHHVGDRAATAPWVTVSPDSFAEQMAFLADNGLVLPLDQLLAELRRGRVPRGGHVVLTFDDAALDTYTTAFPLLRRLGLPATVFVPTGLVGRPGPFWWDRLSRLSRAAAEQDVDLGDFFVRAGVLGGGPWIEDSMWRRVRLLDEDPRNEALDRAAEWLKEDGEINGARSMGWDQLAELDASGLITLGAHTVSHPVLAALDPDRLAAEVTGCRDALSGFKSFRKVFAYPYGDAPAIGDWAKRAVREAGFEAAFTTEETALAGREDRMALGRVCIDEMAFDEFRWAIDHHLGR
jgi:peptidoglycan/xylan/chitin deacetylase (PgdA/CDA1 family)